MKQTLLLILIALFLITTASQAAQQPPATPGAEWKAVEDALGCSDQDQPDGTHKYSRV